MKILVFTGDRAGCFYWRVERPFAELKRFGVEMYHTPTFPSAPGRPGPDFETLVRMISAYDLCICQRINSEELIRFVVNAAFMAGVAVLHEVDDDYINLPPTNPCHFGTALNNDLLDRARAAQIEGRLSDLEDIMPELEASRVAGLNGYKRALSLFDGITVTTPELKSVLLPYNKEIKVLQNNMEACHFYKDQTVEESDANGRMVKKNMMGMHSIPSFYIERDPTNNFAPVMENGQVKLHECLKISYAGTLSHREDWWTIHSVWQALVEKYAQNHHFVYIGDPWFYRQQTSFTGEHHPDHNPEGDGRPNRRIHIEENTVPMYLLNLRCSSIFVAPLTPNIFNMSKSDLKALEGASWGACPVLPDYITYSRNWVHGKTAMLYKNQKEFLEIMEFLIANPAYREQIGRQARQYVHEERLEKHHTQERYDYYKSVIDKKKPLTILKPNKEKVA